MTIAHQVKINRSVSEVWEYINCTDNRQLWMNGFLQHCPVKGKEGEKGACARSVFLVSGREIELREELLEILPYEKLKKKITNRLTEAVLELHLAEVEQLTILSIYLKIELKGVRSMLLKMFWQPVIGKKMLDSLNRLKEMLERQNVYVTQIR